MGILALAHLQGTLQRQHLLLFLLLLLLLQTLFLFELGTHVKSRIQGCGVAVAQRRTIVVRYVYRVHRQLA
jgi:hypothetical protein